MSGGKWSPSSRGRGGGGQTVSAKPAAAPGVSAAVAPAPTLAPAPARAKAAFVAAAAATASAPAVDDYNVNDKPWFLAVKNAVGRQNSRISEWCWHWVAPDGDPAAAKGDSRSTQPAPGSTLGNNSTLNAHTMHTAINSSLVDKDAHGVRKGSKTPRQFTTCACCFTPVEPREGAALMCGSVDHFHCASCLEVMAIDAIRLCINRRLLNIAEAVKDVMPGMVTCSVCHHPSLLSINDVELVSEHQPTRPFRKRTVKFRQIIVDADATNALTYHVDEIYQNERRSWMGKFGKENLLLADNRGPWSNEDGSQKVKLRSDIRCPNPVYHWIGEWRFESTKRNDANGWEYALNWPGDVGAWWGSSRWHAEPGPMRFVRRRKWRRLRLRLSEDDILLLTTLRRKAEYWTELLQKVLHDEY